MKKWHYVSLRFDARNFPNLAKKHCDEFLKVNLLCFCEQAEIEETIKRYNINFWVVCNKEDQHEKYMSVFDHIKEEELDEKYYYVNFFGEGDFKFKKFSNGGFENVYLNFKDVCHRFEDGSATVDTLKAIQFIEDIK